MVRFILKRKYRDEHNGMESSHHETILCNVPELESAMARGGHSESGYDVTEFIGMSIECDKETCGCGEPSDLHLCNKCYSNPSYDNPN